MKSKMSLTHLQKVFNIGCYWSLTRRIKFKNVILVL